MLRRDKSKEYNKWFKFIVLYLGAVVLSMSQLKIVPISSEISMDLGISATQTSLLMSVFTFSALFLAIPAGGLISKFGAKRVSVFVMFCLFLGNFIGIFANSYAVLLISRIIEGVSFSMINIVGIIFINDWFKDGGQGTAIGIFGTFSAFASMVAMNIYRPIYESLGLKSVWVITAILAGIITFLYKLFFQDVKDDSDKEGDATLKEASSDKNIWILSFAIGCMSLVLFTFLAIYPNIFKDIYFLNTDKANYYSSLFGLFGIPFGLLAGIIIDKTGKPGTLAFMSNIVTVLATFFVTRITKNLLLAQVFLLSAALSMNSTSINITLQRTVKRPALLGYSLSILYLFYYIGTFIGPPITTQIMEVKGWNLSMSTLAIASLAGTVALLYYVLKYEIKKIKTK
ncbi:MFS transporter [Clostridium fermenticellae]|uniref:MFS transporter n=1 Tax=Clostridium fermenticellae TaxID=2068654 RepID=A0A386H4A3_9CLOT|nr:MFS transporter [Clostridium fermenticellae]AYD40464.1 MFS transporter [Clostridium fermenticellae]